MYANVTDLWEKKEGRAEFVSIFDFFEKKGYLMEFEFKAGGVVILHFDKYRIDANGWC